MPPVASRAPTSLSARVSLIRLWNSVSPPSFPRTFPCAGALFPPRGPSGRFPRFLGTKKHSVFLPPVPPHFVSFARWYRRCALSFAPAGARRSTRGPGFVYRSPPHRLPRRRRQDLPGSWSTPHERAVLFDPGGILTLGHYRASMLPSTFSTVSASATIVLSGLNHPAHAFAVYASQHGIAPSPRKTRFRMAGLPFRAGLATRWVLTKGFRLSFLPSQASPGAPGMTRGKSAHQERRE